MKNHDHQLESLYNSAERATKGPGQNTASVPDPAVDDRILRDIIERLANDDHVNATKIEVAVLACHVTLMGLVDRRHGQQRAEDIAESVPGVRRVENRLKVM